MVVVTSLVVEEMARLTVHRTDAPKDITYSVNRIQVHGEITLGCIFWVTYTPSDVLNQTPRGQSAGVFHSSGGPDHQERTGKSIAHRGTLRTIRRAMESCVKLRYHHKQSLSCPVAR